MNKELPKNQTPPGVELSMEERIKAMQQRLRQHQEQVGQPKKNA